jgi:L-amino acid N-acyltransferase YncA
MGIAAILASISFLNPESLAFHRKMGFQECGRFVAVGRKKERDFDEVWMQKIGVILILDCPVPRQPTRLFFCKSC